MIRYNRVNTALTLLVLASTPAAAQTVELGGQVRVRAESRSAPSSADTHVSLRTRLHLSAGDSSVLGAYVQLQDVRRVGGTRVTANTPGLHQAYIDVGRAEGPASVRVGRQEAAYGGERLVGAVDWTQHARTFDGLRARTRLGAVRLDALALQHVDVTNSAPTVDERLFGLYSVASLASERTLDAFVLHDRTNGSPATGQTTLGLRHVGHGGPIDYRVEAAYQLGDRAGREVRAHMLGARAGTELLDGRVRLTAWYDRLSGDRTPPGGETHNFDTLFATNHKFYGYADLFLNIPVHTDGRGLQDIALKTEWTLTDEVELALDGHLFRAAEAEDLDTARLGEEIDLTVRYRYDEHFTVTGGVSRVFGASGLAEIGRLDGDLLFGYLMIDATL